VWCLNIDTRNMANQYTKISNKKLFVKDSTYLNRAALKQRIIKDNLLPYFCFLCNNDGTWKNKKLVLILDHINGIRNDHRLENLRFVCPNCDSQLPTYKSRNIKYQEP
jgi:5-methylcytosine-specific restriction endonuclease McrA